MAKNDLIDYLYDVDFREMLQKIDIKQTFN